MPSWLIAIGSIVGLVTGLYTLWDKLVRQRPFIWMGKSAKRKDRMVVKVRNPGDRDVALIGTSVKPRIYDIANSFEFDQLIDATLDNSSFRLVFPGDVVELPVTTRVEKSKHLDSVDRRVLVLIYWRRTSSMWWPRFPLCLLLRTSDLTRLSGAEV
jgi:hypothetical protein